MSTLPAIVPLTTTPGSHWFGYYDKWQFDATDTRILGMRSAFDLRSPAPGDTIEIGLIDLRDPAYRWQHIGRTQAWNWQAGCMLQWIPGAAGAERCIWNEVHEGQFGARILDPASGHSQVLPHPVFTLHPHGQEALTIDFHRLEDMRPGYGYYGSADPNCDVRAPDNAGIWRMKLTDGSRELIVSLAQILAIPCPQGDLTGAKHYVNVLIYNPSGNRFLFLHRWRYGQGEFATRMMTANRDGTEIRVVDHSGHTSHLIWRDDRTILAWSRLPEQGEGFFLFPDGAGTPREVGHHAMPYNGHCTYLPNRDWILNDTYPQGAARCQRLYLYHVPSDTCHELGAFSAPPAYTGAVRCDLHPRCSRDGSRIVIDSAHANQGRQMYLLHVGALLARYA